MVIGAWLLLCVVVVCVVWWLVCFGVGVWLLVVGCWWLVVDGWFLVVVCCC